MALAAHWSANDRTQGPHLLELDGDTRLPAWIRVAGGTVLIVAFATLVGLWMRPLIHSDDPGQSHPSPAMITIPALRALIPDADRAPHPRIGPTAAIIELAPLLEPAGRILATIPQRDGITMDPNR